MFDPDTVANYYTDSSEFYLEDNLKESESTNILVPKPIIHKCRDGKLVCLNYHNPDGQDIPKMEDSHLLNTIPYLVKRAVNFVENIGDSLLNLTPLCGEIADFSIDQIAQDILYIEDRTEVKESLFNTWLQNNSFRKYVETAKNRGLKIQIEHPYYEDEDREITYLVNLK